MSDRMASVELTAGRSWTIGRLAYVTGFTSAKVQNRLQQANCQPHSWEGNRGLYDPRVALPVLYSFDAPPPETDHSHLDPDTMTVRERKMFFESEQKRLDYEVRLGRLISREEVLEIVAKILQLIKVAHETSISIIERDQRLPADQVGALEKCIHEMQEEMRDLLIDHFRPAEGTLDSDVL